MDQKLKAAATAGDIDGIRKLGGKIDQVTEDNNESVLHLAALSSKYSSCVEALLDEFPSLKLDKVNFRNETALHLAAGQGYDLVVKVLLFRAYDLKSRGELVLTNFIRKANVDGDTALHLAIRNNHPWTVEAIVRVDPNDKHSQNLKKETPLYLAATIAENADEALKGIDLVGTIIRYCKNPGVEGPEGRTALHAAVIDNSYWNVCEIMRKIPSLYQRADNNGWTAFHWAASYNSHSAIDALISEGNQEPDARRAVMAMTNSNHQTAHHIAAFKGHINVLKKLIDYCPDVCEAVDEDCKNILHIAAEERHGNLIQSILCDYPDVVAKLLNMQAKNGDTPLHLLASVGLFVHKTAHHIAASNGHINLLTTLIKCCPDGCKTVDEDGRNILHIAAEQRHGELIQSILCDYPKVVAKLLNMQDKNGDTPLHLLVSAGGFDVLPQLIQLKGVDLTLRNRENMTAQDHLYVEEEIVGDELRIRNAFVDIQVKNSQKYVRSQESSVPEYIRRRKDTKFKKANTKIMKDEVNLYRARTNTQIIVTALIATVTFTVGFTMPGGNYSGGDVNEGLAVLSRKAAFNVCMVANTIGLLFSASSLFLYFISSLYEDPHDVSKFIAVSTGFNIVSVVAMMLTFITGTYVVLSHSPALAISLCAISGMFFLLVILLLIKWKYDPKEKFQV